MNKPELIQPGSTFTFTIEEKDALKRLDVFVVEQFPLYSRTFIQELIQQGAITINGLPAAKSGARLKLHDVVTITNATQENKDQLDAQQLDTLIVPIIFEHEHFLIINKPAGLVVHYSHTKKAGEPTLIDWITAHFNEIKHVGAIDRPGIVHRLDKDTSGLMIIARTNYAQTVFTTLFKERTIHKTYRALVVGAPEKSGLIDMPIGRNPVHRHKMAVFNRTKESAVIKSAQTAYKVLRYFESAALVEAYPATGRTHQIRVHFAAIGHPLLADKIYGTASKLIARHALHAYKLNFIFDGEEFTFTCEVPADFEYALQQLEVAA